MNDLLSSAAIFAPPLLGACLCILVLNRTTRSISLIAGAVGVYAGLLTVSLTIEALQYTRTSATASTLSMGYVFSALVSVLLVLLVFKQNKRSRQDRTTRTAFKIATPGHWRVLLISLAMLTVLVVLVTYLAVVSPIQAWDVFGSWSFHAMQLIDGGFQSGDYAGYGHNQNHPSAATTILAWGAWYGSQASMPWALLWVLAWIASGLIVGGYALVNKLSVLESIFVVYAALTIPIFEAHAIGTGYSEVWLGLTLLGGTAAFLAGLKLRSSRAIIFGLFVLSIMVFTRKTGVAHLVATLMAIVTIYIATRERFKDHLFIGLGAIALTAAIIMSGLTAFDIIAILETKDTSYLQIDFAGRNMNLQLGSAFAVIYNEVHSKVFMQSFSLVQLIFLLGSLIVIRNYKNDMNIYLLYLSAIFLSNWAMFLFGQYFFPEIFRLAQPGNDTSISRAFASVAPIGLLIIIEMIAIVKKTIVITLSENEPT